MNRREANRVLRKVLAYCPSQSVDEYTPDAWVEALDDVDAADALDAVARIGRRELEPGQSRYIEPGHIRAEVRRIRADRLARHEIPAPPASLPPAEYLRALREATEAIASGHLEPEPMPTSIEGQRRVRALIDRKETA